MPTLENIRFGTEFDINTLSSGFQEVSSVATLTNGEIVVVWHSYQPEFGTYRISGKRLDQNGNTIRGEFGVTQNTIDSEFIPSVAALSDGGYVVVWQNSSAFFSSPEIYFTRFDANGSLVSSETRVNTFTTGDQDTARVIGLSGGGFVITWDSYGQDGSEEGIYGQIYDSNSAAVGAEFRLNTTTASFQSYSSLVPLNDGGFLGFWHSWAGADGYDVIMQRFDAVGAKVGGEQTVNTTATDFQVLPSATMLSDGRVVITWASLNQDGDDYGIFARILASDGTTFGTEFAVNTLTTGSQSTPVVTALSDGGFVIVWRSDEEDGDGLGVFGQRYLLDGSTLGPVFQINTTTAGDQKLPDVTALDNGGFLVTWDSFNVDGSETGIVGQIFRLNTLATAQDLVQGTAALGETLTVDLSAISDADGLGATFNNYSYQWYRDGVAISGETSESYTITSSDFRNTLTVRVQFTDDRGNPEELWSTPTLFVDDGRSDGPERVVNAYTTSTQTNPSVAALDDGGWVIVWESDGQDGSDTGIYLRRYGSDGNTIGADVQVHTTTFSFQSNPSVAALDDGGFVVSWTSWDVDGDGYGVVNQRYDAAGFLVGGEGGLTTTTTGDQVAPSVTGLPNGGLLVLWNSIGQDGDGPGIYGQLFAGNGNTIGAEFRVNTTTAGPQTNHAVAINADSSFTIVWHSPGLDGSGLGVVGQRYDATGTVIGGEFVVNASTTGDQGNPGITALTGGGFVVTWADTAPTVSDPDGWNIIAQRYDSAGLAVGGEVIVNSTLSNIQNAPHIQSLSDGGYVIVWQSLGQDGDDYGIYASSYDASGTQIWDEVRVNASNKGSQRLPRIEELADGRLVAVWVSDDADSEGTDIVSQVLFTNAQPLGEVSILGSGTEGVELTADTSTIFDVDGLGAFSYQWLRDGIAIASATSATYTPVSDDIGAILTVEVSYTDGIGGTSILTSAPTVAIEAAPDLDIGLFGPQIAVPGIVTTNNPDIATLSDGTFVVVWDHSSSIRAQRYDADGTANGSTIIVDTGSGVAWPEVTELSGGGYVVTWYDNSSTEGVQYRVFNTDGSAVTGTLTVAGTASLFTQPSIEGLSGGGFVIGWDAASGDSTRRDDSFAQVFAADGTATGSSFQVNTFTNFDQFVPTFTALDSGGFVAVWQSNGQDGSSSTLFGQPPGGVFGQLFNALGAAVGSEFQVNTYTSGTQNQANVAALADGGFIVAWSSDGQDGSGDGIFAQRYDSTGIASGNEFQVNTSIANEQYLPSVTGLSDGGFVVVWTDQSALSNTVVTGQRYTANGALYGGEFQVALPGSPPQHIAVVTGLENGRFAVVWEADAGTGVYAQIFTANRDAVGEPIITGTVEVGNTLGVDLSGIGDTDGLTNPVNAFQWFRDGEVIQGATDATFTLSDDDANKKFSVQVTFQDDGGVFETLSSVQTAQVPLPNAVGGEFTIATLAYPTTQLLGAAGGGFLAINTISGVSATQIEFQFLNSDGTANGSAVPLSGMSLQSASWLEAALLSDGTYALAWIDTVNTVSTVFTQRVDATGALIGSPSSVATLDTNSYFSLAVAGLTGGGYAVTWTNDDASEKGVYARVYDASGAADGNVFPVNTVTDYQQYYGKVTGLTDGTFLVAWESEWENENVPAILARHFAADGTALGSEFKLNTTGGVGQVQALTALEEGGFAVSWSGSGGRLYLQTYRQDVTPIGPETRIDPTSEGNLTQSAIIPLSDGGFLLTWKDSEGDTTGDGIRAQRFAEDGSPQGEVYSVNATTALEQYSPTGVQLVDGNVALAWMSFISGSSTDRDIVGQIQDMPLLHPGNSAPVANDDAYSVDEDGNVLIFLPTLQNNDTDADNDVLTIWGQPGVVAQTVPLSGTQYEVQNGVLQPSGGNYLRYTPDAGFSGTDSFTYTVNDGKGGYDTATVNITVNPVADAPNVQFTSYISGTAGQDGTAASGNTATGTVTPLANGGYATFWLVDSSDTAQEGVFGQRYDSNGAKLGSVFQVNTSGNLDVYAPSATTLSDGKFVVAWTSTVNSRDVLAQMYNADGTAFGTEFTLSASTGFLQTEPHLTPLANGGFIASWTNTTWNNWGTYDGISIQIFDGTGTAVSNRGIFSSSYNAEQARSVSALEGGGFVVTYHYRNGNNEEDVVAAQYADDGTYIRSQTVHLNRTNTQIYSDSAALVGGDYVVTWQSFGTDGDQYGIFGQRFSPSGPRVGAEFQINATITGNQELAGVTALPDGGFLVSWVSDAAGNDDIWAQRFDANGEKSGLEFAIASDAAFDENWRTEGRTEALTTLTDGRVALVYSSSEDPGVLEHFVFTPPGALGGDAGSTFGVDILASLNDTDGSETLSLIFTGFPEGATFSLGAADGTSWVIPGAEALDLTNLTMTAPTNSGGDYTITVVARATEIATGAFTNSAPISQVYHISSTPMAVDDVLGGEPDQLTTLDVLANDVDLDGDVLTLDSFTQTIFGTLVRDENGTPTDASDDRLIYSPNAAYQGPDSFTYTISDVDGNTDTATVTLAVQPQADAPTLDITRDPSLLLPEFDAQPVKVESYTGSNSVNAPSVAALDDGGYVVSWSRWQADLNSWGVLARQFDSTGTATGPEFQVNTFSYGLQQFGGVSGLSDGGYMITWESQNQDGSGFGIYAKRYAADGTEVGTEFRVNTTTSDNQRLPSVETLENGDVVFVWNSYNEDGNRNGVIVRQVTALGALVQESVVNATTSLDQQYAAVAPLNNGGYVITWQSHFQDLSGWGVFGRVYDAAGNTSGADIQFNTFVGGDQRHPAITGLADGGFVAAWESANQDGSGTGIVARVFDANGVPVGPEVIANQVTGGNQMDPSLTELPNGDFVLTWHIGFDIFARRFDSEGTPLTNQYQVDLPASPRSNYYDSEYSGEVSATLNDGRVVTVWRDNANDIYSRIFTFEDDVRMDEDQSLTGFLDAALVDTDGSETLMLIFTGMPSGTTFNFGAANGAAWEIPNAQTLDLTTLSLTPPADFNGRFNLTVIARATESVGGDQEDTAATFGIVVNPVEDPPVANDDAASADEDGAVTIDVLSNDKDADLDPLTIVATTAPTFGTVSILNNGTEVQYTPNANFNGADSFTYAISDGTGQPNDTATVTVTVNAINDLPITGGDVATGFFSTPILIDVLDNDTDPDGDLLTVTNATVDFGAVVINGDNTLTFTADLYFVGDATISYTVDDGNNGVVTETAVVTVTAPGGGTGANDTLVGTGGHDTLYGLSGNDFIDGLAGNDELFGGDDNDRLEGGGDSDTLDVGSGQDSAFGETGNDLLIDGEGNDLLNGGPGFDTVDFSNRSTGVHADLQNNFGLVGGVYSGGTTYQGGTETNKLVGVENVIGTEFGDLLVGRANAAGVLEGLGGNDRLTGGIRNDVLDGGAGNDSMFGEVGNDTLRGSAGEDLLNGGPGFDLVDMSSEIAGVHINLQSNFARVGGSYNGSAYIGFTHEHRVVGMENVIGTDFADLLVGRTGAKANLDGGAGNDRLEGGIRNDVLRGGLGDDSSFGNDGNDTFVDGAGDDLMAGANGFDWVDFSEHTAGVHVDLTAGFALGGGTFNGTAYSGATENNSVSAIENVIATDFGDLITVRASVSGVVKAGDGDDRIVGSSSFDRFEDGAGDDTILAGDGNDTFLVSTGNDVFDGQAGNDVINMRLLTEGVSVDMNTGAILAGGAVNFSGNYVNSTETKTILNVERVTATEQSDIITGFTNTRSVIDALGGDDFIFDSTTNDLIEGGLGNDEITLSGGSDRIIYALGDGSDTIYGFGIGDRMVLSGVEADFANATEVLNSLTAAGSAMALAFSDGALLTFENTDILDFNINSFDL